MNRVNDAPVVIARRLNGPPGSGHGGCSSGCAGVLVDAAAAEVTLRRPPPLERPLFSASGERRASGRAVWVELARPLGT